MTSILRGEEIKPATHRDLWEAIERGICAKGVEQFAVQKIKAHKKGDDITDEERPFWEYNQAADKGAVEAARRHALPEPTVGERCALCRDILQEARIDNPHKARARCPLVLVVAAKLHAVARGGDVQDDEMRPVLLVVHGGHVPGAMCAPEAHGAAMGKCFEHAARGRRDGPRPVGVEHFTELCACHHRVQCSAEKLGVKRKN